MTATNAADVEVFEHEDISDVAGKLGISPTLVFGRKKARRR